MNKTLAAKNDFLGLVAFGSVIGNLVQADERRKLQELYRHLVMRYRLLFREYQTFRQVNDELQRQVVALRAENNRLLNEQAATEAKK